MSRKLVLTVMLVLAGRVAEARGQYSAEELAVGKRMYESWCASCHGLDGRGDPPERTVPTRPMDLTDCAVTSAEPDRDWETVIYHGGPAAGLSGDMAAWGEALGTEKIRQLIVYLRSFCPEEGWPRGELNFTLPLLTEKAFPENELVVRWQAAGSRRAAHELKARLVFEKRFGKRSHLELALPLGSVPGGPSGRSTGLGDVEVGMKHVLLHDWRRGTILSAGFDLALPSGSESRGLGLGTTIYQPYLAFGQKIGELEAQAQLIYERPQDRRVGASELILHSAIGAPLGSRLAGPWALLELSYVKELEAVGRWNLSLTPQLRLPLSRRNHLAVNGGVELPVAGESFYRYRMLFYFLWEYLEGGIWW